MDYLDGAVLADIEKLVNDVGTLMGAGVSMEECLGSLATVTDEITKALSALERDTNDIIDTDATNREVVKAIAEHVPRVETSYVLIDYHTQVLDLLKTQVDVAEQLLTAAETAVKPSKRQMLKNMFTPKRPAHDEPFNFRACVDGYQELKARKATCAERVALIKSGSP